jgi:hypothetical protein
MFSPFAAEVTKNTCPTLHVAGNALPVAMGFVEVAALKSMDLLCVRRSTWVCAGAMLAASAKSDGSLVA